MELLHRIRALTNERGTLIASIGALEARLNHARSRLSKVSNDKSASDIQKAPVTVIEQFTSTTDKPSDSGTIPLYFEDSYRFETTAIVQDVRPGADNEHVISVDKTIFHPQGGGQPSDTGSIKSKDGSTLAVRFVGKAGNIIEHTGSFASDKHFKVGEAVSLHVDEEPRRLHARIHSAGHLLDSALTNIGRTDLIPTKGYHFSAGPYVEYLGVVAADDKDALIVKVNAEAQRLIDSRKDVEVTMSEGVRTLNVGGTECPCGGTHVKNVSEIKTLIVTRIKKVKKSVRFSYSVG